MLFMSKSPSPHIGVVLGIVAAMVMSWVILRLGTYIDKWIGAEGAVIVTQLFGFLLAALAIEIGSTGIRELFCQ
jgi:multiple antibiotic resistance protein